MNPLSSSMSVRVAEGYWRQASITLLRYDGDASSLGYEPVDSVEFLSGDGLTGIALGGQPGDVGWLLLSIKGRNSARVEFSQTSFQLEIPFKIRPCHKGFHGPVKKESITILGKKTFWTCECRKLQLPGIRNCTKGRHLNIRSGYWAGNPFNIPDLQGERSLSDLVTWEMNE
eukprot:scpid85037/ scgid30526/ 